MVDQTVRKMLYHGVVVIWLGLLAGIPFGFVILGSMPGETRAWHMAHMEGVLNGMLIMIAALALPVLRLEKRRRALYAWLFIVTGYGNIIASVLGALFGVRGLALALPATNLLVFTLFGVAVVTVFAGLYFILKGAQEQV
jgi:hypothetical protein